MTLNPAKNPLSKVMEIKQSVLTKAQLNGSSFDGSELSMTPDLLRSLVIPQQSPQGPTTSRYHHHKSYINELLFEPVRKSQRSPTRENPA